MHQRFTRLRIFCGEFVNRGLADNPHALTLPKW
jgi:hypothetical protein